MKLSGDLGRVNTKDPGRIDYLQSFQRTTVGILIWRDPCRVVKHRERGEEDVVRRSRPRFKEQLTRASCHKTPQILVEEETREPGRASIIPEKQENQKRD